MNRREDLSDSELKRLLRVKKRKKKDFTRDQAWRFKRVDTSWRRPKGIHNKVRKEIKGRRSKVKVGYRSPKAVRFLHPSGKEERRVRNTEDMYNINPQKEVVRIAGTVGRRKRREIVDFAQKYGIKVLNPGTVRPPEIRFGPEEEEAFEEELFAEEREELFEGEEEGEEPSEELPEDEEEILEEEEAFEEEKEEQLEKELFEEEDDDD